MDMEVDGLTVAALLLLVASLGMAGVMRRRAARRREEERARARARRRKVPVVSANVRGLPSGATDLWTEETVASTRKGRVA
jgi:phage protein D